MKYLIAKIYMGNNAIEYGKVFDSETEATEQAIMLNETAEENGFDTVQFMVLPCVTMPKVEVAY